MKIEILGVKIDNVSMEKAVRKVEEWLGEKQPRLRLLVTVNPEFVVKAQKDDEFLKILNSADLAVPDGAGVVLASRLLNAGGKGFSERVAGVDLMEEICRLCAKNDVLTVFFGGRSGVADKAADCLRKKFPGLLTEVWEAGEVGEAGINKLKAQGSRLKNSKRENKGNGEEGAAARTLRADPPAGGPEFLCQRSEAPYRKPQVATYPHLDKAGLSGTGVIFVALGMGKQEKWIIGHKNELEELGVKVAMGVGGSFDYLAGSQKRAPVLVQKAGLEWLWRLILEPKRWRRQLALVRFGLAVLRKRSL